MEKLLGIDIGGTDVKIGVVTGEGGLLESGSISTMAGDGPEALARRVRGWYDGLPEEYAGIRNAGIDCAGLIDREEGILHYSPNLDGWTDVPLGAIFTEALGMGIILENDVNAASWGEYVMGAGRGTSTFVAITLGTGVGGGIVIDGRLYYGAQGMAGEIGHHVIDQNGPKCLCGNRGCVEAFIAARAIIARVRSAVEAGQESVLGGREAFSVKDIAEAASAGDQVSTAALAETGRYLGIALANVVHILNPEVIAVGGGVAGAGDLILGPARKSMKEHLMSDVLSPVRVVPAVLGNRASFTGAALLAAGRR